MLVNAKSILVGIVVEGGDMCIAAQNTSVLGDCA